LYSTQQVKTFEYQSKLPRLPVPSLQHTLELYEKSTLPLRFKDDDNGVQESIRDFIKPGGQGQELQKRLEAYDKQHPVSACSLLDIIFKCININITRITG
jgi:carnitine O-acetyltransferase